MGSSTLHRPRAGPRVRCAAPAFALPLLAALVCWALPASSQDEKPASSASSAKPSLQAGELTSDFHLDGRLNDRAWQAASDSIPNLTTIEPEEGGTPAGRTVVKVLADLNDIVVG